MEYSKLESLLTQSENIVSSHLQNIEEKGEDFKIIDEEKFENTKLLVQSFMDNEYKALTEDQYNDAISNLPF